MKLLIVVLLVVLVVEGAKKEEKKTTSKKTDGKKAKKETGIHFKFEGKDHWGDQSLKLCYKKTPLPADYLCYKYYRNYEPVYIDPVAVGPVVFVFRKLIPQKMIDDFLHEANRKLKRSEKKRDELYGFMSNFVRTQKRRIANETTLTHKTLSGVSRVFRRVQALIPTLNFTISGPWQVLWFKEGGHHAPHYDYITYSTPDQYSRTTREYGNRFATFEITLKAAEVGGETTFVFLNQTVKTSPGDVLFFTNINKDMQPASASAHADCPVEKGEKVTATLFLRPRGQELFNSHPQDEGMFAYDLEKLVSPNPKFFHMSPMYDFYYYQQQMMEYMQLQMAQRALEEEKAKKKKNPFA